MKIRIGIGLGRWPFKEKRPEVFLDFIDCCESLDIDSLWLSDRVVSPVMTLEPVTFMAYMASRMRNMKFGTSALVLPTRNPVILAKQLATLDFLSQGRLLLVVGLGSDESKDFEAVGIRKEERGKRTDEAIVLMRKLWTEENVTFDGKFHSVRELTILPRPYQKAGPPIWVGGRSQAALRRAGHLSDGWLVSSATSQEMDEGIETIRRYAAEAGREVPEDHYGVLIPFFFASSPEKALDIAEPSIRFRSDISPVEYCALGTPEQVRRMLRKYMDAGASKFVMRPCGPGESWYEQVEILAKEVINYLQTPFSKEERLERAGLRP
ncbi:MAG: LLM class flavin-dependent oxidoreductase [Candidatus Binatia bacterium]